MKLSTKPMPSPGRTEKYPTTPLFMRRLRLQGGNRSRRSRPGTRPMFSLLRRKASNYESAVTQEPSSPKVTCIGQVRVKKKTKKKKKHPAAKPAAMSASPIPQKTLHVVSRCFSCRSKSIWQRFMSAIHDVSRKRPDGGEGEEEEASEEKERIAAPIVPTYTDAEDKKEDEKSGISIGEPEPPKNALLLMRCRSAPLRDASPATMRFCESPASDAPKEIQSAKETTDQQTPEEEEDGRKLPTSPARASADGKRRRTTGDSSEGIFGMGKEREGVAVLTRCKSEPRAPSVGPAFPEAFFWKRRMGF